MMEANTGVVDRAAQLKQAFDASFVGVREIDDAATEDFISIRVADDAYMLRLSEITGFFVDKKVTRLPNERADLAGLAGFRGAMLPVYDLAALLGYAPAEAPRWIAVAAAEPFALAFASFEGHARLPKGTIAVRDGHDAGGHLREVAHAEGFVRPIVDVPSIAAVIRGRTSIKGITQE